ncbi:MAG: hypothetical protein M3019_05425 [Candidatus Dormibacteraeota bacterium]|nr:hypothetical protein [Candidatus Dormibacteraeota bacterium]
MGEDNDLEDRLRAFLAESTSVSPPPRIAESVEEDVTHRRSRLGRLIASAVLCAAIVAGAILVLLAHTASLHNPQSDIVSPSPRAALPPAPSASLLKHVDSALGQQQCLAYVRQHANAGEQLEAEYDMTAGEVNAWEHKILPGGEPSSYLLRNMTPATPLYFCFIHGEFAIPVPAGGPVPNRIEVAIDDSGKAYEVTYGFSSAFPARPV